MIWLRFMVIGVRFHFPYNWGMVWLPLQKFSKHNEVDGLLRRLKYRNSKDSERKSLHLHPSCRVGGKGKGEEKSNASYDRPTPITAHKAVCCIFRPGFGSCACQTLVEIVIFSILMAKSFKKKQENLQQNSSSNLKLLFYYVLQLWGLVDSISESFSKTTIVVLFKWGTQTVWKVGLEDFIWEASFITQKSKSNEYDEV